MPQAVITKFPQVDHHEATGELRAVYDDIHATLRVPWVAFAIRVMSQFPAFVPSAWAALKPNIATRYAEDTADMIREAAIVPGPPPPDPRPALIAAGWSTQRIDELHAALDALNYGNPKYLVLITAWNEAWHGRDAGGRGAPLSGRDAEILPYGLPSGVSNFHLVDPDTATVPVQTQLARVRDLFLHHGPASDYRVLANWPEYLEIAATSRARRAQCGIRRNRAADSQDRARAQQGVLDGRRREPNRDGRQTHPDGNRRLDRAAVHV
jgi:hypothetical protein